MKVSAGEYRKIYDPSAGEKEQWYINDHTIVRGRDGWHLFGITHEEPANPYEEKSCAHAVGASLTQGLWEKLPSPIRTDPSAGETHFWAPHVVERDGLYYMFWCAGSMEGSERYKIQLATSEDLYSWERSPANPMVVDGFDARDPMVLRVGDAWIMYYTATSRPQGGNHVVAAVTSRDLIHWSDKRVVFTDPSIGKQAGPCESPFVVYERGRYFLFIGPRGDYCETGVFMSDDPFHFEAKNQVGRLPSHAAEVICDDDHGYYVTSCGWGQGGVYLAPLTFDEQAVFSMEAAWK